jgi:hypothetical protein
VRQTFLLDENILYHAIRRVDKHDNPDSTAADLLAAIARICHGIFVHQWMLDAYNRALRNLRDYPPRSALALLLVKQFLYNSLKRGVIEQGELPALPAGVVVPAEDEMVVRAALISRPVIVTADSELQEAVNRQPSLGLTAMDARAALAFAQSEPVQEGPTLGTGPVG